MKMIKYIVGYICLLISLGISNAGYAQDIQYEEHSLRILVKSTVSNKNIPNLLNADSTLNVWLQDVRPSFPHSQDEMLRRVYLLHFDCTLEQIQERLADFPWIEEIMPIEKVQENMLYNPTDYLWQETKTNPSKYLWHLTKIEAEKTWDITKGSPNVKIAVIDLPIDASHPDLVNKMVYDYDPYDPRIKMIPTEGYHGTTVASFAAASTDDAGDSGADLAAIGFNCKIVGYAQSSNFLEKSHHASFIENAAVIVSCYGYGISKKPITDTVIEKRVVKEILDNGTIIVTPAGNGSNGYNNEKDGKWIPFYPFHPSYDNRIIIVSSTDINDNHTYYNDEGENATHSHFPEVTVCAPGYSMMGAQPIKIDDAGNPLLYYGGYCGTSFSAPIVAGLCGLMKSVFPKLTPAKAKQILETTTDPIKDAHLYPGLLGAGRINAYKAVAAVKRYANTCQATYTNQTIDQNINKNVCILHMDNTTIKDNVSVTFKIDTEAWLNTGFSVEKGSTFAILPDIQ